jgi:hypothetical protein
MKHLGLVTASWLGFVVAVIVVYAGFPCLAEARGACTSMWHFLPWPPGVATAAIAGGTGAWINGLFRIVVVPQERSRESLRAEEFLAAPLLGGAAAVAFFFIVAAGGLSVVNVTALAGAVGTTPTEGNFAAGALLYALTPDSTAQLATLSAYSLAAGYSYSAVPKMLEALFANLPRTRE